MSNSRLQQFIEMTSRWQRHLTPMPEELRLTAQQMGQIQTEVTKSMPFVGPPFAERIILFGIPVTIVERDEDSTFYQEQYIRAINESWLT